MDRRNTSRIISSRYLKSASFNLAGALHPMELPGDLPLPLECHTLTLNMTAWRFSVTCADTSMPQCPAHFQILFASPPCPPCGRHCHLRIGLLGHSMTHIGLLSHSATHIGLLSHSTIHIGLLSRSTTHIGLLSHSKTHIGLLSHIETHIGLLIHI